MITLEIQSVTFEVTQGGKKLEPRLGTGTIDTAVDAGLAHANKNNETFVLVFNGKELTVAPGANRQDILDTYYGGPKEHGTFVVRIE